MSALYPKFKESLMKKEIDLLTDDIKLSLIDTGEYTYSSTDQFFDDIPSAAIIGTSGNLSSKSVTDGVFDADDVLISGLTGAPTIEAVLLWLDSGTPSTSRLIGFIDQGSGLPINAGAVAVSIVFDNGSDKIFKL